MVMLLAASFVAYKRFGKTSIATRINSEAIVIHELAKACLYFPLLSKRGIFAIANIMINGKIKNCGFDFTLSLRCGTYSKVYTVVTTKAITKNTVKFLARIVSFVYKR